MFASAEVFAHKQGGDLAADLLCSAGVLSFEGDKETGHAVRGLNRLDPDRLLGHFDAVVEGTTRPSKQVEALDDGLHAGAAQNLFLHGGQARREVLRDNGNDVLFRDLLFFDENERLRHVLGWQYICQTDSDAKKDDGADDDQAGAPLENCKIVFCCEFTMA